MRGAWLGAIAIMGVLMGDVMRGAEVVGPDPHSYSRPDLVRVVDLDLALDVDFASKVLTGKATWKIARSEGAPASAPLVLDTRDLKVDGVRARVVDTWGAAKFEVGARDAVMGSPLSITLPAGATDVEISYTTSPGASALQWVEAAGTFGKMHPFLFTQSQAIHARSWIPCQDTPGVRVTYRAMVRAPQDLTVVMSALRGDVTVDDASKTATTRFRMPYAIPSYLIALAVGNLEQRAIGQRTAVWAEPEIVEKVAWEFADTERMVEATEARFGRYRWERYDILVLPPSFPYGGMENPMLTFATPTVLAGDRSQVALIAHELAHSWSGNLVTNATWGDFWLNEGFTTYLQNRIVEDVYGVPRAEMENVLGHGELLAELKALAPRDQLLKLDLAGRDPDEGVTRIAYEKGAALLKRIEAQVGRERLDAFLKEYFDHFAFQSLTTAEFEAYLKATLFSGGAVPFDLKAWIHEPGLPNDAVVPTSPRFQEVEALAKAWVDRKVSAREIDAKGWTTLEWLHFLRALPSDLSAERLAELDAAFGLTKTGNAEIACQWFEMAIRGKYAAADEAIEAFLSSVGRRKLIIPLYAVLIQTPEGRARARAIFEKARAGYHPIAVESIAKMLGEK